MSDYDSKIIRRQIRVYGSVQGVGFRYRTEHAAESVGATGWVRNDPDGSVFMEIQGTEEQIDRVFAMVSQGTYVNIEKMDAKSIPVVEDERGFHTRESLGECVLVIEGRSRQEMEEEQKASWEKITIEEHMEIYENQGHSRKEAMKMVANDRGMTKRDVYQYLINKTEE